MDQNLFKKHIIQINKQKSSKQDVITHIYEISGVFLEEKDFTVTKNKIKFNVSSVVQTKILQKKKY